MRWSLIFILFTSANAWAQELTADFTMNASACMDERLKIENVSGGAAAYEWDFCAGDLDLNPTGLTLVNSYGGYGTRVNVIEQDGMYYGFFIGRAARKLFRLDFGSDIKSQPTLVDLGDLGLNSSTVRAVEIAEDNGAFYGFVVDNEQNALYRFNLGSSLTNYPSPASLLSDNQELNSPMELAVVSDNNERFVFVVNSNNRKLVRFELEGSLGGPIKDIFPLDTSVGQWLNAVSFLKEGATWYCVVVDPVYYQVIKLKFNDGLKDTTPSLSIISVPAPLGISLVQENGSYYAFVQSQNPTASIFRINFGASIDNAPLSIDDLNQLQLSAWGFSMVKVKSDWVAFATNAVSPDIYKLTFPNRCLSTTEYSTEYEPSVTAANAGSYFVSLTAKDTFGNRESKSNSILVTNSQSPDIDFNNLTNCANHDLVFASVNVSGDLMNYSWNFGDLQSSTDANPTHLYTMAGDYAVSLHVSSSNGCNNYAAKNIHVYDSPVAQFDLPTAQICTNNEFTFTNTTVDNFDGQLTYEWLVNDELKSVARNFNYSFQTDGDYQIQLKTSIPGCSDEMIRSVNNIQTGPVVNFTHGGKCEEEIISFTNESTGSIVGFLWDFGTGTTTTDVHPTQTFTDAGSYTVSLTATSVNGCASTFTKPINIYSVPQTNFYIDLPPFACTNSPSQFNDITPPMPDSNIASWSWSFGDEANGSAIQKNPSYIYSLEGDYTVSLTTSTNYGCSNTLAKSVTIFPSPSADFSFGPACLNKGTQFTDLSSSDVKAWMWIIQGNTYSVQNPIHTFNSSATYTATLSVTAMNNCISQVTNNVVVPIPVSTSFTFTGNCINMPTMFDEIIQTGNDPAVSWSWNFDNQSTATDSPAQHVFTTGGNHTVTMHSTRQSGCTYSVTRTIPVVEAPHAAFSVFQESGPAPLVVNFANISSNATTYQWQFGDAANTISSQFSPSFTYTELGNYIAELTVSNSAGCFDHFSKEIRVVIPQINAAITDFKMIKIGGNENWSPVVTIQNKGNIALISPEVNLDLSGNVMISNKINDTIQPNESFTYTFASTIAPRSIQYACAQIMVSNDEYIFDNRQCVNLIDDFVSMVPYPNPAQEEVILEWIGDSTLPMELIIYNTAGQVIMNRKYSDLLPGLNQVKLDVSNLQVGIYFITYSIGGRNQNFRFSIVR